ncbi:MAG: hypothetical protein AB7I36_10205 [Rhodospirillaceae bacterium]
MSASALAQSAPASAPSPQPEYHPSFGDLMTFAVQPRHIKLGLAGHARNWAYAAFEAKELRNAFARIGRTIPIYQENALPDLFAASTATQMEALEAAIKAQDAKAFDAAYKDVTAACNTCHASLNHGFIVIQEPKMSPYSDQNLTGK